MPKITKIEKSTEPKVIQAKTKTGNDSKIINPKWWQLKQDSDVCQTIFAIANFLQKNQAWRQRQSALYARLYGNLPIWNYIGLDLNRVDSRYKFPSDRPTMNVIQSCTDTLVAKMVQNKPKPVFLTSGGDYKRRILAKELNQFMDGEFYQTKVYEHREDIIRDSCIFGDGMIKVYETDDHKVGLERVLATEILVDDNDGKYRYPQQMYQLKLIDRDMLAELFPEDKGAVMNAQTSYFDSTSRSTETIVSQVMIVEGWHLPSVKGGTDGRHVICIDNAVLLNEAYEQMDFPFVKFAYSPRPLGYWSQGMCEQLMGTQAEINRLLYTIQQSLFLCGIPKWLVEDGSKVVSAHLNNQIGGIIRYQGTPPAIQVAQCIPTELYQQLERLIQYAYQQSGISQLAASSVKPAGLNSGAALREYNDTQTDRLSYMSQRDERWCLDVANKMFIQAKKIAKKEGKYQTIYPGNKSLVQVSFPGIKLDEEDFTIQAFPKSAYSNDPAFRKQEVIEDMQGGLLDPQEGRRLLDFPDLKQVNDLLNAPEERIFQLLDKIVEDGDYISPDPTMDLKLAEVKTLQYINKFAQEELEQDRMQMLHTFLSQIQAINMQGMQAMPAPMAQPQANPMPTPQSDLVPNVNPAIAA